MHHDLDPVDGDAEEPVGLDQLETLVRERRGVDRDLRAHAPRRVRERLRRGDVPRAPCASGRGTGRRRRSGRAPGRFRARAPRGIGAAPNARCRPGAMVPPPRSRARSASSPAATRLSLFASARVTPCSSAQSVARMPAKPTMALSTTSGLLRSSSCDGSPPTWTCSTPCSAASASRGVEPDWSAQSSSSGCLTTTSMACRPIEPVAPSRATRLTCAKDA